MTKTIKKILTLVLILFYIGVGIYTICYAFMRGTNLDVSQYLGLLVILSSVVHILLYFIQEGYKNKDKMFYLILGLIGLSLGIVFLCNRTATIDEICFYWGILDIIRGSEELAHAIPDIKNNKLEIVEVVIALGDIVLGILLCVKGEAGITAHLVYLGVAFLLTAIKFVVDIIIDRKVGIKNEN